MDMTLVFINNLKKWRKNRGLSQKKLAEKCNAAHSYIRQIESKTGHPSFAFIEKLANALDIEPYKLFIDDTIIETEKLKIIETIKTDFLKKMSNEFDNSMVEFKNNIPI